ncbi:MAG: HAMP domain-containing histidine kinase [Actinobacteria bacterium]|nr:MAG: HAMP domain-containing histidine kinase [Actinomycetota bacterium]
MTLPRGARSLTVKLSAVLFLVVTIAIVIVYLAVVPRLETRLVNAKIDELERAAPAVAGQISQQEQGFGDYTGLADVLAATLNARVVIFEPVGQGELLDVGDSNPRPKNITADPVARAAAAGDRFASGRVERDDSQYAEVAFAAGNGGHKVVLLAAPLHDALSNSRLVRRSLIIAGLIALLVSILAGSLAAWTMTRRLRGLEAAAERLSSGDFVSPIEVTGEDEVGQLARTLDRMRLRLAQLDDVRREFIANASHELRTPLFSLGGFLELLADEDVDETTRREFLQEMRGQVDRLTKLATDLLDLSRLDAGQLSVESLVLDLTAIARTLVEEFRPVAELHAHELRLEVDGAAPAVGDEQRVLQIGRILVENAVRHTPDRTGVAVGATVLDGQARLVVRDDGPGIDPADQERLFERFHRGSSRHASGSGLGLAIASELAQRMGGSIVVESQAGKTVFMLELPAAESNDDEVNSTGKRRAPAPGSAGETRATAPVRQ